MLLKKFKHTQKKKKLVKKKKKEEHITGLAQYFPYTTADKEVCRKIILQQSFSHGISCFMSLSSNFPMLYKPGSNYRFFQ